MKSKISAAFCAVSAFALVGCGSSAYGPPRLVTLGKISGNSVKADAACDSQKDTDLSNLAALFVNKACAARSDPMNSAKVQAMLDAGFTLSRVRCTDFFAAKAGSQTKGRILRSTLGPLVALMTGIVALHDFSDPDDQQDYLQAITLFSGASLATLDIFEEHFLFGAENINSVRRLTMRALDTHQLGVEQRNIGSFGQAVRHLIDHQMICTPANILEITQQAIAAGEVKERNPVAGAGTDLNVLAELGPHFGYAALTADQAGGLWWLIKQPPQTQEEFAAIQQKLSGLGQANPIQKDATGAWTSILPSTTITSLTPVLDRLSQQTQNRFNMGISQTKLALQAPAGRTPAAIAGASPLLVAPATSNATADGGSVELTVY